jgi:hypothetical protein
MTNTRQIYILRSQCTGDCGLDKMDTFYRLPNATPAAIAKGLRKPIRKRFWTEYKCQHVIKFTLEKEKVWVWDLDQNKAVKRELFK